MENTLLPTSQIQELRSVTASELLKLELPEQECIVEPWLTTQGLAMIFAPRGIGKTHVSLGVACAVATGLPFLEWSIPKSRKVLFIDGEMPGAVIQERIDSIKKSIGYKGDMNNLKIITPDLQKRGMPDLSTNEGQIAINRHIDNNTDLIIVDNLSTLVRSGNENEADSWTPIQNWALAHRSQGRTILFIHHSGKAGQQRGTSRREDVLDTVLSLKRPTDYTASEGARFEVHFEKARSLHGDDVIPFEALLSVNEEDIQKWTITPLLESNYEKIIDLHIQNKPNAEIARILNVNKSTVTRNITKARNANRF